MNSWELFEAMTDLEDDTILAAVHPMPRKRARVVPLLRHLTAACLVLVLFFTCVIAFDAEAGDATMRYTLRIREDGVRYIFWNSPSLPPEGAPPYGPTWLPEGYRLTTDWSDETSQSFIYTAPEDGQDHIWFSCAYVGDDHSYGIGLEEGTYTRERVTIGEFEADHFIETETDGGWLVWIDREAQIRFHVSYRGEATFEEALGVAESVRITEGE